MSSLIVEVCKIKEVINHPNADRLDIVKIKGWDCIVQRDAYVADDLVIYAPIDSMIPIELSDKMDVTKYLAAKGRVRTAKLRGVYSQGLIIPLKYLPNDIIPVEGLDVADVLNITKYFPPPPPVNMQGIKAEDHPSFFKYTDIENVRNYPDVLVIGEEVVITEKLDGSNFRAAVVDDAFFVGSHNLNLLEDDENIYWKAAKRYGLENILKPGQQIFGEVYGGAIQKRSHGLKEPEVAFFDLMIDKKYVDYGYFLAFCVEHDLPVVPILHRGPWSEVLLGLADNVCAVHLKNFCLDNDVTPDNALASKSTRKQLQLREGLVIKPVKERWDRSFNGRVILKHINPLYDLRGRL